MRANHREPRGFFWRNCTKDCIWKHDTITISLFAEQRSHSLWIYPEIAYEDFLRYIRSSNIRIISDTLLDSPTDQVHEETVGKPKQKVRPTCKLL